jgi:hypothetical protein
MPKTDREVAERKCSTCGGDMFFVTVVDKDTKKERPLEGVLLSGTVRKYRCPKGHVETNENGNGFWVLRKDDSFTNAKELIMYMRIHQESPRALVSFRHLVCLTYLAGWETGDITQESFDKGRGCFQSLHSYPNITTDAFKRLQAGDIPENWLYQLTEKISKR